MSGYDWREHTCGCRSLGRQPLDRCPLEAFGYTHDDLPRLGQLVPPIREQLRDHLGGVEGAL